MLIAYAKGARTFERHVDIEGDGRTVSPYCSRPDQIDTWFKSYQKAGSVRRTRHAQAPAAAKEIAYLDSLVRGVYAKRDLPEGHILTG